MLKYHFSKLGPEGWAELARAPQEGESSDPNYDAAWRRWVAPYDLPEFTGQPLHSRALRDLAGLAEPLPRWASSLLEPHERTAVREEVKKQ